MKILFICENSDIDYQKDMLFHGLVSLGHEVIDSNYIWYMSKDADTINCYGRGFSITKLLSPDRKNIYRDNLENRIKDKEFDRIIYGSIWRCHDYIDVVLENYSPDKIFFVDGEDHNNLSPIYNIYDLNNNVERNIIYFKREFYMCHANYIIKNVYPISFAIPKEKFNIHLNKSQLILDLRNSRKFYDENEYYEEYGKSLFGYTSVKSGWDCLRHYEIISQYCLPYFEDFQYKPTSIMTNWPVDLQIRANILLNKMSCVYRDTIPEKILDEYWKLIRKFYDYALNNLTTEALAKYVLDFL